MRAMFLLFLVGCGTTSETDVNAECERITTLDLPLPVAEPTGVWDADRGRLVFFGGDVGVPVQCQTQTDFTAEVWAWYPECGGFLQLTGSGPSPRGRQATALDAAGGRMIIHGGRFRDGLEGLYTNYDDTWAFDLASETWEQLSTSGPGARVNHATAVVGDKLVLFGGNNSTDGAAYAPLSDTWTMDLASGAWSPLTTTNDPDARLFHAYASDGETLWVYGGTASFFGPFLGDLHALDVATGTWTELHPGGGGAPAPRFWANMVHDEANGRLLLWAGHDDTDLGNTNQLWSFDLGTNSWTQFEMGDALTGQANGFCDFPSDFVTADLDAPERRNGGLAVMDGETLRIFGGESDCGILNDVWSWTDTGRWVNESRTTGGEICQRTSGSCSTLCF
ncbi:MAG: hypothetical protein EP330_02450 [Deltaproteobacteria bacterium]|nr:MAG: hypothetical protein EP330_02450 [Deltaproteobacteria bacterium]